MHLDARVAIGGKHVPRGPGIGRLQEEGRAQYQRPVVGQELAEGDQVLTILWRGGPGAGAQVNPMTR